MIRFLIRCAVFLGSAVVGLLIARWVVDDLTIDWGAFVGVAVVFAALQSLFAPFIAKVATNNAPALIGASGLLSTFLALLVCSLIFDGLRLEGGPVTWLVTSVVVWLATMLATLLLPMLFVKRGVQRRRQAAQDA